MPSFEVIKKQMQGDKGLIKTIRTKFIPSTIEMSELAQKEFENQGISIEDIDYALDKLLVIEYEIYLYKQEQVNNEFIKLADDISTSTKYPAIRESIDVYKKNIKEAPNATHILNDIVKIITALADSNRQSRVSRAGTSLMEHISYLLQKKGFVFEKNYQREYVLKEGCKLDFFFPNIETYNKEPKDCCSVACQTTSNDRFRLTFAQMPADTRNRACTAIGSSNFTSKLGPDSLTDNKLQEAKKNGVKFVILKDAINRRLKESNTVMSYTEWFTELNSIKPLWT